MKNQHKDRKIRASSCIRQVGMSIHAADGTEYHRALLPNTCRLRPVVLAQALGRAQWISTVHRCTPTCGRCCLRSVECEIGGKGSRCGEQVMSGLFAGKHVCRELEQRCARMCVQRAGVAPSRNDRADVDAPKQPARAERGGAARVSDFVWYFAYASNLSPQRFGPSASGARKFKYEDAVPVCLDGYELVFNAPGIAPFEPVFGNIQPRRGAHVRGVAYKLSTANFRALALSEGAPFTRGPLVSASPSRIEQVSVRGLHDQDLVLTCSTCVFRTWPLALSDRLPRRLRPSQRYQRLILNGIDFWGLGSDYRNSLEQKFNLAAPVRASLGARNRISELLERIRGEKPQRSTSNSPGERYLDVFMPNTPAEEHLRRWMDELEFLRPGLKLMNPAAFKADDPPSTSRSDKPLLVFIPGIDGSGLSILPHVSKIEQDFDLRILNVPAEDRKGWRDLADSVHDLIEQARDEKADKKDVFLFGESMGAVLALFLAQRFPRAYERIVILNPATSFASMDPLLRLLWINAVPNLSERVYNAVPFALVPQIYDWSFMASQMTTPKAAAEAALSALNIDILREFLPAKTLQHRLNLLDMNPISDGTLKRMKDCDVHLLVAPNDRLIPSLRDSKRLLELIPRSTRHVLKGGSHAALLDARIDFSKLLRESLLDKERAHVREAAEQRAERPLVRSLFSNSGKNDFRPPTPRQIREQVARLKSIQAFFSPVFIGMERVPHSLFAENRPILLIANHTMYGLLDIPFIVKQLLENRGVLVRGLAHPAIFRGAAQARKEKESQNATGTAPSQTQKEQEQNSNGVASIASTFEQFGALSASPRALYRMLKANEAVLLFPGGAREAYKRRGEKHTLHWPEDPEFVRMALKFNALVVPVACVGPDDSFQIVLDSSELLRVPVLGKYVETETRKQMIGAVRSWKGRDVSELEALDFLPPVSLPKAPRRVYIEFGEPIDLQERFNALTQSDERARAATLYSEIRTTLAGQIQSLEKRREGDSYDTDTIGRLLYERMNQTSAPVGFLTDGNKDGYFAK
ncbi:Acyltransferase-like protein [Porphyridium purpureum]|uniref:Acyltransferase-like protein n=1 Tax=Porphyridium purpureum TaxID=35688 RepID=A0A5J4Z2V8_PORPP|nr:Acyltransferase-like protein [Porphyridium purpureum]|eukprot:POR8386..scf295_1